MISDNHIAYGSRVSRHGSIRPFSLNHCIIVAVKLIQDAKV